MTYRVLVVDDEAPIRNLLSATFKKAGFAVLTAADVPEAMARCSQEPFHVVLSDARMPGLSGHDLVRWLAVEHPATRTAMMSGCDLECSQCPFDARCSLLMKPFRPSEAVALVHHLVSDARSERTQAG